MTNPFKLKTPNLKNRRTRKSILNAYTWATNVLSDGKPRPVSRYELDRELTQASTTTGAWLRYHLLKTYDESFCAYAGQCKTYTLNVEGAITVSEILELVKPYNAYTGLTFSDQHIHLNTTMGIQWALERYPFNEIAYEQKSNRYWHGAQNLRKSVRNGYLKGNGLNYQYDLVCAAQTLLLEKYRQLTGKNLEIIESYVNNRDGVRQRLSHELQLPIDSIKTILTALFAGARVVANNRNSIYQECHYDKARIEWIKQDPFMTMIREEMTLMWKALRKDIVCKRLNSSIKWKYYYELEKQVMDVFINKLKENNIKYYIIHDCIATDIDIDIEEVKTEIYSHTGLSIQIDKSNL